MSEDRMFKAMQTLQTEVAAVRSGITGLTDVMGAVQTDVTILKTDVSSLKSDVASLKADVATIQVDIREIRRDVSDVRTAVTEHLTWHLGQTGT